MKIKKCGEIMRSKSSPVVQSSPVQSSEYRLPEVGGCEGASGVAAGTFGAGVGGAMFWSQIWQVFGSSKVAKFGNFELLAGSCHFWKH